jgi:hypothetical protein
VVKVRSQLAETAGARAPELRMDRVPAAADSDGATAQTVRMMCDYVRKCVADPQVQAAADYAWRRFGAGSADPAMKCWGVFWWVKHCIKFRLDEATLFRIGERNQQDLLTAPDVLLRMKHPAEDCDGFTMLAAALLTVLGVPVVIATVAADPADRSRWSHVFPCALLPGDTVLPLDASHMPAPGAMVPPERIFRWQAWNLDGDPVQVEPLKHRGLHGYVRSGRGMGWGRPGRGVAGLGDCSDPNPDTLQCPDGSLYLGSVPPSPTPGPVLQFPYVVPGGGGGPAPVPSSTGSDWTQFWQNLTAGGMKILGSVVTPPAYQQVTRDAYGNVVSTTVRAATGNTALTAAAGGLPAISTNTLLIGGGLLAVLLIAISASKR